MNRGQVWLAEVGGKRRPVLVLTRDAVLDVRELVTVAEITTSERGLSVEVPVDADVTLDQPSVINCDGLQTVPQRFLTTNVGQVSSDTMEAVCRATALGLGCSPG